MATGVNVWSKTAALNNVADSAVNWQENQAPSSVNDSARGMMAATAKWRDDLNGTVTTAGSSTAYTATSNQTFAALTAGIEIACQFDEDCGATVTLNVDGLGAKPLRAYPGVELVAGALKSGGIYHATYKTSNSGEWILHDVNPTIIAAGQVVTASIADANVTNAKLANMANATVKGRTTSGSGAPEDLTLSQVLDLVGSAANGDILIRSAGSWTRLAKATDGNALILSSGVPAWGGTPGTYLLSTQTASASSALVFTGLSSTYREYIFALDNVRPASGSGGTFLAEVSTDGGSSWNTTTYLGGPWAQNSGAGETNLAASTAFTLSRNNSVSGTSGYGWGGRVSIQTPSASVRKIFTTLGGYLVTGDTIYENVYGSGIFNSGTAVTAVRFRYTGANITDGSITMYGVK